MKVLIASNRTLIGQSLLTSLPNLSSSDAVDARHCTLATVSEAVRIEAPHVVLVDATTNYASAISTMRKLIEDIPDVYVVLLGAESDEASIYEAILEGAAGYVTMDESLDALRNTLHGVMRGELGLSRAAAQRVVRQLRKTARASSSQTNEMEHKLTAREQQVFDLVRRGQRSREIAEQLSIAEATVYKHIQNILDKLQVHSRTQAIFMSSTHEDS